MCLAYDFSTLSQKCCYFWSEIDMFHLNVFYITFWDLSNGIHGFSYKWPWKSTFSHVMVSALYRIYMYPENDRLHFMKPLRNHFLVISYALLPIFGKSMFGQNIINKPTWAPWLYFGPFFSQFGPNENFNNYP